MDLLSFDEVRRRLRIVGQSYLGVRAIPVARIVGSLDRNADFDRDFHPLRRLSRARLGSLRTAFPDGNMPPIEVQELGGAYFVADGHHRVALARELRAEFVDAEVTRLQTNYYPELLELVKAHGYDLSLRRDSLQSREDVAADWHDHVYRPGVEAVQRESLPEMYAYKTDTDLFLWVYQRRRAHRGRHEPAGGEHRSWST